MAVAGRTPVLTAPAAPGWASSSSAILRGVEGMNSSWQSFSSLKPAGSISGAS
eukprot:COSAG04_NODE_714_length_10864_cov_6.272550_2_plen_53_part_00